MQTSQAPDGFLLMGAGAGFKDEVCDMIAGTNLFGCMPWNEIHALSCYVQCYQVSAGTIIFKEGDPGNFMCLLIKGQVEILKEDQTGKPRRLVLVTRGKTVGEMSVVDGEPRSATCIAREDSVVLLLTSRNFESLSKTHPLLALHIMSKLAKQMSQRLRGLNGQLIEFLDGERGCG